ncbi:MAG: hypothetical protein AAGG99_03985 [Pseudomonadota bacterium]
MSTTGTDAVPATGIVVFQPDLPLLRALVDAALNAGSQVYIFANSPPPDLGKEAAAGPTWLGDGTNVGQGAGLNAVLRAAHADGHARMVLFDQDSSPAPSLWRALASRADTLDKLSSPHATADGHALDGPRFGVVAPQLVTPDGEAYLPVRYQLLPSPNRTVQPAAADHLAACAVRAVAFAPTSGSCIDIGAWQTVGPFREDFFIDAIDVEWGHRARSRGAHTVVATDITMPHRWGQAGASGAATRATASLQILRLQPDRLYYTVRNGLYALRLSHIPRRARLRQAARLVAQIGVASVAHAGGASARHALWQAVSDAARSRLGPRASGRGGKKES